MKHFKRFSLLKLCIFLTVVQTSCLFAGDISHLDKHEVKVVKYQLWNQHDIHKPKALKSQLGDRWSEELEVALQIIELAP